MKSWTFYILGGNIFFLFLVDFRFLRDRFLLLGGRIDLLSLAIEHWSKLLVLCADVAKVGLPHATLQTLVDGIKALANERGRPLHIHESGLDELRVLVQTVEPRLEIGGTITLDVLLHTLLRGDKGCGKLSDKLFTTIGFTTKGLTGLKTVQTTF